MPQISNNIQFQIFGSIAEKLDRTNESNPIFQGLFLNFAFLGATHSFKVSKELFEAAPREGEEVWIFGDLSANSTKLKFDARRFEPVSERYPAPNILEENQGLGALFMGPGTVEKSNWERGGDIRYRLQIQSRGFNFMIATSEELYYNIADNTPYWLTGRVKVDSSFESAGGRRMWQNRYTLILDKFHDLAALLKAERPRRPVPEKQEA